MRETKQKEDERFYKWKYIDHGEAKKIPLSTEEARHGVMLRSTYMQTLDWFKHLRSVGSSELCKRENHKELQSQYDDDNSDWKGGTIGELERPPNLDVYHKRVAELKQSDLYKSLNARFHHTNVRRRSSDPHDGEYDHDKRWDLNPFQRATKGLSSVRSLTVYAHMSFSAGVSSGVIDRYGATICAICNLLESYGLTVEIYMVAGGMEAISDMDGSVYTNDQIKLKGFGQYLPPTSLLKAFSSNFKRRVLFTRIIMQADLLGKRTGFGLGHPPKYEKEVAFEKGKLHLFSHSILENEERFLENLEKALGLEDVKEKH